MSLLLEILSWVTITLAVAAAAATLLLMPARRAKGRHASRGGAASSEWRTVRTCCGVILISASRLTDGAATWVLLAAGVWVIAVWDMASWLRTRYRLTRAG
jgi:hypothetical protein